MNFIDNFMYCTDCGHQVSWNANYCGSCGKAFNGASPKKDKVNGNQDQRVLVKWKNLLADLFEGRLGRMDYFLLTSFLVVSFVVFGLMTIGFSEVIPESDLFLGFLTIILMIAFALLNLSGGIRRLHDMNMSGWTILVGFIPLIGFIFSLVIIFSAGTEGTNEYGEQSDSRGFFGRIFNL